MVARVGTNQAVRAATYAPPLRSRQCAPSASTRPHGAGPVVGRGEGIGADDVNGQRLVPRIVIAQPPGPVGSHPHIGTGRHRRAGHNVGAGDPAQFHRFRITGCRRTPRCGISRTVDGHHGDHRSGPGAG